MTWLVPAAMMRARLDSLSAAAKIGSQVGRALASPTQPASIWRNLSTALSGVVSTGCWVAARAASAAEVMEN